MRTFTAYKPPATPGTPVRAEERFLTQAAALTERDWSTIDNTEAIGLRTRLTELCERVAVAAGLPLPHDPDPLAPAVWYHPEAREFRVHGQAGNVTGE
jgi:hypothetical protein